MKSVLETCRPRPELLAGTFNPETFTAALGPVIDHYRRGRQELDSIYTSAEQFLREATYPTRGLQTTLQEVFSRIAGDMTVPAIHRLETAFGGGKTHTLIACTHIAFRGQELASLTDELLPRQLLPVPGTVAVVGVAGDEIPVHKPRGDALVPYTLWGEIAYQIGGEALYRAVEDEAGSYAAPGKTYFDRVLGDRKVLIMLDELAQYAARLEAARPEGASQLAAFLMALHGYARNHPGIAIVLTLASATDAFARQTERLASLISQVRGAETSEDDALSIGEKAVRGVASVVARDAVQITPVLAAELSAVLAKRLFTHIDITAARTTALEYIQMYRRNSSLLPEEATRDNYLDRMIATYPFHPTLVSFLNNKLAGAENFQGTRGVLRVLSLAVRSLWRNQQAVPMIHACHLDLRSDRVVNEILGRTGSSDLMFILNADIGSVDTGQLAGGMSNAELADRQNPHPEGHPMYEYTWKTVFLHSLVGREEGVNSRIFGLSEPEALLSTSFPGLTPSQVRTALEEINESAFYLRYEQGKYFASEEPTLNSVLARIRRTLTAQQVDELVEAIARKVITGGTGPFHIEHDVTLPEHLPDGKGRPVLGIVPPTASSINVSALVTTRGPNRPREQQNLIFLLVPRTVTVEGFTEQASLFPAQTLETRQNIDGTARQVKAMQILAANPQSYGIHPRRLENAEYSNRRKEREKALETAVAELYTALYYPSTGGHIVKKEIKTAGGEGGRPFIEMITSILQAEGEMLTTRHTTQDYLLELSQLFFEQGDSISITQLHNNFCCKRNWPVLESPEVLSQIVRAGVQKGIWCVYRLENENASRPVEFYHADQPVPLDVELDSADYRLITPPGARQRGWTGEMPDPVQLITEIIYTIDSSDHAVSYQQIRENLASRYNQLEDPELSRSLRELLRRGNHIVARHTGEPKPVLIHGNMASLYSPQPDDIIVTREEAARKGWLDESPEETKFTLQGREALSLFMPLLGRLGRLYKSGSARSTITALDIVELKLPRGGTLTLNLSAATPESLQLLDELFEVLDSVVEKDDRTEIYLEITRPENDCALIDELNRKINEA